MCNIQCTCGLRFRSIWGYGFNCQRGESAQNKGQVCKVCPRVTTLFSWPQPPIIPVSRASVSRFPSGYALYPSAQVDMGAQEPRLASRQAELVSAFTCGGEGEGAAPLVEACIECATRALREAASEPGVARAGGAMLTALSRIQGPSCFLARFILASPPVLCPIRRVWAYRVTKTTAMAGYPTLSRYEYTAVVFGRYPGIPGCAKSRPLSSRDVRGVHHIIW